MLSFQDHPEREPTSGKPPRKQGHAGGDAGAQYLGECEYEVPVRDGADYLFPGELGPQVGAFSGAGLAEPPRLAGEGGEVFVPAGFPPDARESASQCVDRG